MRKFKNILYTLLALLPVLPFAWQILPRIANDTYSAPLPIGNISVTEEFFLIDENSLAFDLYGNWLPTLENGIENDFSRATFGLFSMIDNVGLPVDFFSVTAYFLLSYYFVVLLLVFVVDLFTFPLRKGSEILGG